MTDTHISGVLVHARRDKIAEVTDTISSLPGTETHIVTDEGRLVVTIEDRQERAGDTLLELQGIDGVLSASMVYTELVEDSETEIEI